MKKSDIKNGMHVITNNGSEYIIISDIKVDEQIDTVPTVMVRLHGRGWMPLDDYHDDLRYSDDDNNDNSFDIREVYVPNYYSNVLLPVLYNADAFTKVWERPIPKRMTKEEIEAELGYEIEIVD